MIQYRDKTYANVFEQALDIGYALLHRRMVRGKSTSDWFDYEDERQEWAAHLLGAIRSYDPSRGAVSTWTYAVFAGWLADRLQARREVSDHEVPCHLYDPDAVPLYDPTSAAGWSDRALELLELYPERIRDTVALRVGEGHSVADTAAHLGCSTKTVARHMALAQAVAA